MIRERIGPPSWEFFRARQLDSRCVFVCDLFGTAGLLFFFFFAQKSDTKHEYYVRVWGVYRTWAAQMPRDLTGFLKVLIALHDDEGFDLFRALEPCRRIPPPPAAISKCMMSAILLCCITSHNSAVRS